MCLLGSLYCKHDPFLRGLLAEPLGLCDRRVKIVQLPSQAMRPSVIGDRRVKIVNTL